MCCFVELKKASKRMTCHKRYKIQKKVSLGRVVKLKLKLSNLKLLSRARGQGYILHGILQARILEW